MTTCIQSTIKIKWMNWNKWLVLHKTIWTMKIYCCWVPRRLLWLLYGADVSVHDYIIRAVSLQQITCLCRLDLSAAFDTIHNSILVERLTSWFGFMEIVFSWIKSYLTNRSVYINLNGTKSSVYQLLYGVPQGSVILPHLFNLYTLHLSVASFLNLLSIIICMQNCRWYSTVYVFLCN